MLYLILFLYYDVLYCFITYNYNLYKTFILGFFVYFSPQIKTPTVFIQTPLNTDKTKVSRK